MNERVYCLYRVSTTKQVDHNDLNQADIPMQRKACREFAQRMNWTICREEQETGISGYKVSANDRDSILLMKKHAEEGRFDILLVFMFDRLGRKSDETPFLVEWFVRHGIRVWSVNEGEQRFDSHTDRLTNYIRFWQADGESQKTSVRTKTAMNQMVQDGRYRGGLYPYGYRLEKSGVLNKRKHEVYTLVIDEEEAEVVKTIFHLYVNQGYGAIRIAAYLKEHNVLPRQGDCWHPCTVSRILQNVTYCGIFHNGAVHSQPFEHLRIVSDDLFQQAQEIRFLRQADQQSERRIPLSTKGQSLLSGNVFCGHCGGRLILTTNGKTVRLANGTLLKKKRIRYVCYNKTRRRTDCDGQTGYTMHLLDEKVTSLLHHLFARLAEESRAMVIEDAPQRKLSSLDEALNDADARLSKAKKAYEKLRLNILKSLDSGGTISQDVLTDLLADAKRDMEAADAEMKKLQRKLEETVDMIEEVESTLRRYVYWAKTFDHCEQATRKMICCALLREVRVRRGYAIEVTYSEQLQRTLERVNEIRGNSDVVDHYSKGE